MNGTVERIGARDGGGASRKGFEVNPAMQAKNQGWKEAVEFVDGRGKFAQVEERKDRSDMCGKTASEREFQKTLDQGVRAQLLRKQPKVQ